MPTRERLERGTDVVILTYLPYSTLLSPAIDRVFYIVTLLSRRPSYTPIVSREAAINEDPEAGIAYAKLRAVYPHITKDTMAQATPDRPIEHKNANVLGTVKDLENDNASDFYQSLQ